jgi:hippurate hydrolase
MAAATVLRLQTIVSREIAMTDSAVVTVGSLQAGQSENVIPDRAVLRLNIRTLEPAVRERILAAVRRIVEAEAAASGSPKPPTFEVISEYPLTRNDPEATRKVVDAFQSRFGSGDVQEIGPSSASEDFSRFGEAWKAPSMFWVVGGTDPKAYHAAEAAGTLSDLPVKHSPNYAPVVGPTLRVGVETMLAAAGAWLGANP